MTDEEARTAIKAVIAGADPSGVIWPYNALSHQLDEWPGLFGQDGHGWIIKRKSIETEWKGSGNRERQFWTYDIWGLYPFRTGKEGDNSDDEFSVLVDAVQAAFVASPTLDLDWMERHELLQVDTISTVNCGEVTMHIALGRLKLRLCC